MLCEFPHSIPPSVSSCLVPLSSIALGYFGAFTATHGLDLMLPGQATAAKVSRPMIP